MKIKAKNWLIGVGLCLILISLGAINVRREIEREKNIIWQAFTPPDGSFSVLMPGIPEKKEIVKNYSGADGKLLLSKMTYYFVKNYLFFWETKGFWVGYTEFDKPILNRDDPKQSLDRMRNSFLSQMGGMLISERQVPGDYPAREVIFRMPLYSKNSRAIGILRIFFVSDRAYYSIQAVYTPHLKPFSQIPYDEAYKFLDSFKLSQKAQAQKGARLQRSE